MAFNTTVLNDPGASTHLRVAGVVGNAEYVFTDADIRDDPRGVRNVLDSLRRRRFVHVDELRVSQRDGTYTVRWGCPGRYSYGAGERPEPDSFSEGNAQGES